MLEPSFDSEIEIKLSLGSFTDYLKLIGYLGAVDSETIQYNAFFDSKDKVLAEAGWAFRVRSETRRGLVTLKGKTRLIESASIRSQIESEIPRKIADDIVELRTDPLAIDAEPVKYLKDNYPDIELECYVRFRNYRLKKVVRYGESEYMLEVDKTEFPDGSTEYELEVELTDKEKLPFVQQSLSHIFESLKIPFVPESKSKLERALLHSEISQ